MRWVWSWAMLFAASNVQRNPESIKREENFNCKVLCTRNGLKIWRKRSRKLWPRLWLSDTNWKPGDAMSERVTHGLQCSILFAVLAADPQTSQTSKLVISVFIIFFGCVFFMTDNTRNAYKLLQKQIHLCIIHHICCSKPEFARIGDL